VKTAYRFTREDDSAPDGIASLTCWLLLDDARFHLSIIAIGRQKDPDVAPRREDWGYAGEWSRREGDLVFRPATCESQDWPAKEILSAEMAMMDDPFFQSHAVQGEFTARALDASPSGELPARLALPVPREMAEAGGFRYAELVLTRES